MAYKPTILLFLSLLTLSNCVLAKPKNKKAEVKKLEVSIVQPINIDLQTIIAKSIENNLKLQIAKADSNIAKWKLYTRFSDLLPDLNLSSSIQKRDGTFFLNSQFQNSINETLAVARARVDYQVFSGGSKTFLAIAEKYYRNSTESKEQVQYNKTILDSVNLYYSLLESHLALASKLKALESAHLDLDLAKKYFDAGTGTKYDVLQAEARLARAEQALITEEANYQMSQINIAEHLNMTLLTGFEPKDSEIKELKLIDEKISVDKFIEVAKEKNPEIKATLQARKAAFQESLAKVGDYLPKVNVFADIAGSGENYGSLVNLNTYGIGFDYTIGDGLGLTTLSKTFEAKAKLKKAKLEYEQENQRIEKELRQAFIAFQKARAIKISAAKELEAASEALRVSKIRYQNGLEIFANYINKEVELTQTELNLITSTANYNLAQAKLKYYMGTISTTELIGS